MDEALKGSERALHPSKALALLRETAGRDAGQILHIRALQACKHRPGRRLVVRYEVELRAGRNEPQRRVWYGKLYHGHGGERAWRVLRFLRGLPEPGFRLPEPLGYHPRWRFLLTTEVPGPLLSSLAWDPGLPQHLERVAEAVACLHTRSVDARVWAAPDVVGLKQHDASAEIEVLRLAEQRVLTSVMPDAASERFWSLQNAVCDGLQAAAGLPGRERIIHRDLFPAQIVAGTDGVGFLDLDEAALGEPELDVGNLIAHLALTDLQEIGTIGTAPLLRQVFLDAYQRVERLRPDRLRLYNAAALLRLASLERLAQPGLSVLAWPELAGALLAEADRVMASAGAPRARQSARP